MRQALVRVSKLKYIAQNPRLARIVARSRVLPSADLLPLIRGRFTTVIDVGANRGQFALLARHLWPNARIHSFEPVPSAATVLDELFRQDSMHVVHRFALGSQEEHRVIRVPANDDWSSFVVDFARADHITVPIRTLDGLDLEINGPTLMKIDVQGFEMAVLHGACGTLPRIDTVIAECSFDSVEPIAPARDLIRFMADSGFLLTGAVAAGEFGDLRFERLPAAAGGQD